MTAKITDHRDPADLQRLFDDIAWLLDGGVPADEAARRCGYPNPKSLVRVFQRNGRTVPPQLESECYWRKQKAGQR